MMVPAGSFDFECERLTNEFGRNTYCPDYGALRTLSGRYATHVTNEINNVVRASGNDAFVDREETGAVDDFKFHLQAD